MEKRKRINEGKHKDLKECRHKGEKWKTATN